MFFCDQAAEQLERFLSFLPSQPLVPMNEYPSVSEVKPLRAKYSYRKNSSTMWNKPSGWDGWQALRLAAAAYESARSKVVVRIENPKQRTTDDCTTEGGA